MKEVLGVIAIVLTLVAFIPYLRSIWQGRTIPHVFSWIIWGATTSIVFIAQLQEKGGAGAWPTGMSAVITLLVAVSAYRCKADYSITRTDWLFVVAAMTALPLWYVTSDPFWAVLVLTTVDALGFGPTIRKVYHFPFEEQALLYGIFAISNGLAIMALENYTAATVLFPAATGAACLMLITLIGYRRQVVKRSKRWK